MVVATSAAHIEVATSLVGWRLRLGLRLGVGVWGRQLVARGLGGVYDRDLGLLLAELLVLVLEMVIAVMVLHMVMATAMVMTTPTVIHCIMMIVTGGALVRPTREIARIIAR